MSLAKNIRNNVIQELKESDIQKLSNDIHRMFSIHGICVYLADLDFRRHGYWFITREECSEYAQRFVIDSLYKPSLDNWLYKEGFDVVPLGFYDTGYLYEIVFRRKKS